MAGWTDLLTGFNAGYDTTERVMRDYDIAKIARAGVKELPGVPPPARADIQSEIDADPNVAAATAPKPRFEFLGKEYDARPDDAAVDAGRQLAMAGVYEKYGDVASGMGMRRAVRRDQLAEEEAKLAPLRRRSLELGVQREERAAADDEARRAADAASQKWWKDRLTSNDGSRRAAVAKDFTDFSQQRVYDLIEAGRMPEAARAYQEHNAQSFAQIRLETEQRKADGEKALQALYQGNNAGVLDWYNRYAPDGAVAIGVKFGKDGAVTVERKGADGRSVDPLTFKGGTAEMAASIRQAFDPDAMYQWSQGEFARMLALRQDARGAAAAGRAQAEFEAGAGERDLKKAVASAQQVVIDPKSTPAQREEAQGRLLALQGLSGRGGGEKPAVQKLAEYAISVGKFKDPVAALDWARNSAEKSPAALRAELVKSFVTDPLSPKKTDEAIREADEIVRKLYPDEGRGPAGGGPAGGGMPQPKTAAERDKLPAGTQYVAPDGSIRTR